MEIKLGKFVSGVGVYVSTYHGHLFHQRRLFYGQALSKECLRLSPVNCVLETFGSIMISPREDYSAPFLIFHLISNTCVEYFKFIVVANVGWKKSSKPACSGIASHDFL